MALLKKLMHLDVIIDASIVYEVMTLLDGKSHHLNLRPLKHGGDGENGEVKALPTGREFVLAYASAHPTFKTKEAAAEGEAIGLTKMTVSGAINTLFTEQALKRVDVGTYSLSKKAVRAVAKVSAVAKATKPPHPLKDLRRKPAGETVKDQVLAFVRAKQNGSGEGVPVADIKAHLGARASSISSVITKLVADKVMTRVGDGLYRARGEV